MEPIAVDQIQLNFNARGLLIINVGFLFNRTFTPLGQYDLKSDLFRSLQSNAVLKHLPVPVPYPYLEGLDWVKYRERTGRGMCSLYLLGRLQRQGIDYEGFKGYYFWAGLFKVPIPIQLFVLFALAGYLLKKNKKSFLDNELFLLLPAALLGLYLNFIFKYQIGIRYLLVCFPFVFIFCGRLAENSRLLSFRSKSVMAALLVWLIGSVMSYFPHYLSYFNEIVWDRKQAYRLLADSNIDWGQNQWYLQQYVRENPEVHICPKTPVAGRIVVGVNLLVGLSYPGRYLWLRENFEPVDHIAYSYLVYDVSAEDLERARRRYGKWPSDFLRP